MLQVGSILMNACWIFAKLENKCQTFQSYDVQRRDTTKIAFLKRFRDRSFRSRHEFSFYTQNDVSFLTSVFHALKTVSTVGSNPSPINAAYRNSCRGSGETPCPEFPVVSDPPLMA